MTLGGAAQDEQFPECPCCGIRIMGAPVSLSFGDGVAFFCPDSSGCRRRAATRLLRYRDALEVIEVGDQGHAGRIARKALL